MIFLSYAGILLLPLTMKSVQVASDSFFTSSELKSRALVAFQAAVSPLPSGPWQATHFAL